MKKFTSISFLILFAFSSMSAQKFLKKLGKATKHKIENKVENIVIGEVSAYAADKAVKPLDNAADEYIRESYEDSTGEKYDTKNPEKSNKAINDYLASISANVKYEDEYKFDSRVDIEMRDYGSKKKDILSILSSDKGFYGFQQDNNGKPMLIIIDENNNAMISYDVSKNEAMALPFNQNRFESSLQHTASESNNIDEVKNMNLQKLNETKNVLGYTSHGYRHEEYKSDMYINESFPVNWANAFGGTFEKYASNFYKKNDQIDLTENMIMYGESTRKSDNKKSTWEVVKFDENPKPVVTSKMHFQNTYDPKK